MAAATPRGPMSRPPPRPTPAGTQPRSALVTSVGAVMIVGGVTLVIGGGGAFVLGMWILSGSSDCDGEMCALGAFLGLALAALALVVGLIGGGLCVYLGRGVVHRRPGRYWSAVFVSLGAALLAAGTAPDAADTRALLVTAAALAVPGILLLLPSSLADLDAHKRDPVRRRREPWW